MRKGWKGLLYSGMEQNSRALNPGMEVAPAALTSLLSLPPFFQRGLRGALPIQLTEKEQSKGSC